MIIGAGITAYGYFAHDNHLIQYLGIAIMLTAGYLHIKNVTGSVLQGGIGIAGGQSLQWLLNLDKQAVGVY